MCRPLARVCRCTTLCFMWSSVIIWFTPLFPLWSTVIIWLPLKWSQDTWMAPNRELDSLQFTHIYECMKCIFCLCFGQAKLYYIGQTRHYTPCKTKIKKIQLCQISSIPHWDRWRSPNLFTKDIKFQIWFFKIQFSKVDFSKFDFSKMLISKFEF